jgi:hypothetical protein
VAGRSGGGALPDAPVLDRISRYDRARFFAGARKRGPGERLADLFRGRRAGRG